jgi:hypothetical protein
VPVCPPGVSRTRTVALQTIRTGRTTGRHLADVTGSRPNAANIKAISDYSDDRRHQQHRSGQGPFAIQDPATGH